MTTPTTVPGTTSSFVEANGIRVHVVRAGAGRPLVLLHGWPEFWYTWHKLVPLLSGNFELIMPDLRGFGQTEKPYDGPSDQMTPAVLADDLEALADALGLQRFGVVSHDVGAMVAQAFAYTRANRLTGLFFFNCPYPGIGRRWMAPDHIKEIWYQTFHQQPWTADLVGSSREACRIYFQGMLNHWTKEPGVFDADLEHWVDNFMAPGNLQGGFNYYISIAKFRLAVARGEAPAVAPIDVPTQFLWGRHDPVLKADWTEGLETYFTNAKIEVAEDAGHFVHYEAPDQAGQKLREFFSGLPE